ncbi:hypothetical protein GCM10020331_009350 [Ectobacillus funiculus]
MEVFTSYKNGERQLVSVSKSEKMNWTIVHRIPVKYLTVKAELVKDVTILFFCDYWLGNGYYFNFSWLGM